MLRLNLVLPPRPREIQPSVLPTVQGSRSPAKLPRLRYLCPHLQYRYTILGNVETERLVRCHRNWIVITLSCTNSREQIVQVGASNHASLQTSPTCVLVVRLQLHAVRNPRPQPSHNAPSAQTADQDTHHGDDPRFRQNPMQNLQRHVLGNLARPGSRKQSGLCCSETFAGENSARPTSSKRRTTCNVQQFAAMFMGSWAGTSPPWPGRPVHWRRSEKPHRTGASEACHRWPKRFAARLSESLTGCRQPWTTVSTSRHKCGLRQKLLQEPSAKGLILHESEGWQSLQEFGLGQLPLQIAHP